MGTFMLICRETERSYSTSFVQINLKCDQLSGYIALSIPTIPNFEVNTTTWYHDIR